MEIISHRGYWKHDSEKNTVIAFERSFDMGFGTEADFRDFNRSLVISHDPPGFGALSANKFFQSLALRDLSLPVALNVKADGLQGILKDEIDRYGIENYFLFDMAVPDAILSIKKGLRVFTRQSDVEAHPCFYEEAAGVWMDAFKDDKWLTADVIQRHLGSGKQVCVVSPELHGRDHMPFWERMINSTVVNQPGVMLCTDFPEDAKYYFNHG
jgi:hypothetical protein